MNFWWENEYLSVQNNKLFLAGKSAEELARRNGTPLYVYGKSRLLANYRQLEKLLGDSQPFRGRICYAMKANASLDVLRFLLNLGASIDAVSPGEVATALEAGFPAEKIIFTGSGAGEHDLEKLFEIDNLTVNIDAAEQLELMTDIRKKKFRGKKIKVCVRWNPGLGSGFNSRVITAGRRSSDGTPIKFGIEGKKVLDVFRNAKKAGFIPVGLHQHLGSGWTEADYPTVIQAVAKMVAMARKIEKAGWRLEFLDFGGGFSPQYDKKTNPFPVGKYVQEIKSRVRSAGLKINEILLEPGKYLIADAGVLLVRVEYIKKSYGNIFAFVNAGTYNTLARTVIYNQAYHEIINASRVEGKPRAKITVAGHLCETGDVFATDRSLPLPERGELLAVLGAGAYGRSMASNYNLRPVPKEIFI